jgi:hypothetical protein
MNGDKMKKRLFKKNRRAMRGLKCLILVAVVIGTLIAQTPKVSSEHQDWSTGMCLDPNGSIAKYPIIRIDSDNDIHIFWNDLGNLYYKKLDCERNTVVNKTLLIKNTTLPSSVAIDSKNNIHIVGSTYNGLSYWKLNSNGSILINEELINSSAKTGEIFIDLFDHLYITWKDSKYIYCTKLDNNGTPLIDAFNILSEHFVIGNLVDDNNDINIISCNNKSGNFEIYYRKLDDELKLLISNTQITSSHTDKQVATSTIDLDNSIHIVWNDDKKGYDEIYYMKINNDGGILRNETRMTFTSSEKRVPIITSDLNNDMHLLWVDDRNGLEEIFYKKLDKWGNILINDTRFIYGIEACRNPSVAIDLQNNINVVHRYGPGGYSGSRIFYKWGIPDLKVSKFTFSKDSPLVGEPVLINATIINFGMINTPLFTVGFYFDDILVSEVNVSIAACSAEIVSINWSAKAGNYLMKVLVDIDNDVNECNETNNEATGMIRVKEEISNDYLLLITVMIIVISTMVILTFIWKKLSIK